MHPFRFRNCWLPSARAFTLYHRKKQHRCVSTCACLVQIIQYIGTLLPKLPPELQEHTDNEHKIVMRTPYILQLNPNLNHFQANYTGLFVSTLRYMSEPEKLEEFVNRVRNIGSMYMQGYSGKEAAAQLKKL